MYLGSRNSLSGLSFDGIRVFTIGKEGIPLC